MIIKAYRKLYKMPCGWTFGSRQSLISSRRTAPLYRCGFRLEINLYKFWKWGLGRSPKRGEGGSPTLSPFPRGRGLGIGIINLQFVLNTNFKSGRLPLCKYIQVLLQYLLYIPTAPVAIQQFQPSFQHFLFIIIFLHKPYICFLLTFHKHFRTTNLQYLTSPSKCREKSL